MQLEGAADMHRTNGRIDAVEMHIPGCVLLPKLMPAGAAALEPKGAPKPMLGALGGMPLPSEDNKASCENVAG